MAGKTTKINVSVNEKLCKTALKSVNSSMDGIKKKMGSTGSKSSETIIGCVEKLNDGFRDTQTVDDLYKAFNTSLETLKSRLDAIDKAFDAIDKYV